MRVLHVYNRHRHGGGSDNAWDATIALSRSHGLEIDEFERDSGSVGEGLFGRISAAASGVYARSALFEFRRAVERFRPDVVHAHELYPLISYWVLRESRHLGVPVVLTCYDYRLTCPVATHYRQGRICLDCVQQSELAAVRNNCRGHLAESAAYALRSAITRHWRLATDYVTRFVVPAEFGVRWLSDHVGIASERVDVVPCVIPMAETGADPALGTYAAFAGRFVPEKGIELLIESARMTSIPLKLAGNEPRHPAVRESDNIECVLTSAPGDLARFYRGARMLVMPSTWYETFGIVAAESLSHGIPVVASRIGALATTVRDGISGILVPPGDRAALCAAMSRLWSDPEYCRKLGAAGRAEVGDRFSAAAHMTALINSYSSAISPRP